MSFETSHRASLAGWESNKEGCPLVVPSSLALAQHGVCPWGRIRSHQREDEDAAATRTPSTNQLLGSPIDHHTHLINSIVERELRDRCIGDFADLLAVGDEDMILIQGRNRKQFTTGLARKSTHTSSMISSRTSSYTLEYPSRMKRDETR